MIRMGRILHADQNGFSIVEVTLVAVGIILLASAAGLVANRQQSTQSQQLQPNVIHLNTSPSTPSPNPTTTTLELAALGIDLTVPNAINDLTYAAPDASGGYGVSTKALSDLDTDCQAISPNPPLGDFYKGSGTFSTNGSVPGQLVKQFSAFYIAWKAPAANCSESSSTETLAAQQIAQLEASFKTIVQATPDD